MAKVRLLYMSGHRFAERIGRYVLDGFTEITRFDGEYVLLVNPRTLSRVRVYDGGAILYRDSDSAEYTHTRGWSESCWRCASELDAEGFCTDITCPFNDHLQQCANGWIGNPAVNFNEPVPCTCSRGRTDTGADLNQRKETS